jgi:hypothetical protein
MVLGVLSLLRLSIDEIGYHVMIVMQLKKIGDRVQLDGYELGVRLVRV